MSASDSNTDPENSVGYCAICDATFSNEYQKERHYEGTPHKVNKMRKDMGSLLGLNLDSNNHYVYTIVIKPINDDREFYYVGTSRKPFQRIANHMRRNAGNNNIGNIPSKDGEMLVRKKYDFVRFVDIEEHSTKKKAMLRERQKMFEIAKEHDEDIVLGGM